MWSSSLLVILLDVNPVYLGSSPANIDFFYFYLYLYRSRKISHIKPGAEPGLKFTLNVINFQHIVNRSRLRRTLLNSAAQTPAHA